MPTRCVWGGGGDSSGPVRGSFQVVAHPDRAAPGSASCPVGPASGLSAQTAAALQAAGHITPAAAGYLAHWLSLIDQEEANGKLRRQEIWGLTGEVARIPLPCCHSGAPWECPPWARVRACQPPAGMHAARPAGAQDAR
jgi:hypothetical protein